MGQVQEFLTLVFFSKFQKKICPEATEGKLSLNFFFDRMILYGQEGLNKYSSNEISKSALGKNHPSVQCTVYSVQCTVYSVQCTVYSVQCTVYSVQCTVYSVHCAVCSVHYSVHCSVQW